MKILFIGDIVGKPGRDAVSKVLPSLKKERQLDLVLANGENLAHGRGFTGGTVDEMLSAGVDYFTSGNHVWDQRTEVAKLENKDFKMIRPANFPDGAFGRGYAIIEGAMMQKILVINVMGRVFMKHYLECPFKTTERILKDNAHENFQAIFVDFHAEATSEKVAFANYFDSKVSAIIGTHTHVPTCDHRILPGGTGYCSDAGMTGPIDSIIGMKKEGVIQNFLTQMPSNFEVQDQGQKTFNAVLFEIDESTQKTSSVERVDILLD